MSVPTVRELAQIIGRAPNDLNDKEDLCGFPPCGAADTAATGTCICAELYREAATRILARFSSAPEPDVSNKNGEKK